MKSFLKAVDVNKEEQDLAALQMTEEAMAKTDILVCAFNQSWQVSHADLCGREQTSKKNRDYSNAAMMY